MAFKLGQKAASQIASIVRAFGNEVQGEGQDIVSRLLRQPLLDVIYLTPLGKAAHVLKQPASATVVVLRQIAFADSDSDNELSPNKKLQIKVVGRSKSRSVAPGTIGQIGHTNGEWRPLETDCEPSAEGLQVVVTTLGLGVLPFGAMPLGTGVLGTGG